MAARRFTRLSLSFWPGESVSASGLRSRSVSSETSVFSAMPDSVSPDLTVYVLRLLFGRLLLLGPLPVAVAVAVAPAGVPLSPPAGSLESWTTEYSAKAKATSAMGARNRAGLRRAIAHRF